MHAEERRRAILNILRGSVHPVSASALAGQLSVSRQIIVGDIALLAGPGGAEILATPRGYCLQNAPAAGLIRRVAVRHSPEAMEAELDAMVDQGCTVVTSLWSIRSTVSSPARFSFPAGMTCRSSLPAVSLRTPYPSPA